MNSRGPPPTFPRGCSSPSTGWSRKRSPTPSSTAGKAPARSCACCTCPASCAWTSRMTARAPPPLSRTPPGAGWPGCGSGCWPSAARGSPGPGPPPARGVWARGRRRPSAGHHRARAGRDAAAGAGLRRRGAVRAPVPGRLAGFGPAATESGSQHVIRGLLVDDQSLRRMGFRMILEAEADIAVVGEAGDGIAGVSMAAALRPDVVLMDVRMPRADGIEATAAISATGGPAKVLILTTYDLDRYVYAGLRAGASGFLLKDAPPADLLAAIRTVADGAAVLAPTTTRRLIDRFVPLLPDPERTTRRDRLLEPLTDREREVFALLARGQSNREIASGLHLSESTIKIHVGHILAKLNLRDRVHAVVRAYETGLITPESQ